MMMVGTGWPGGGTGVSVGQVIARLNNTLRSLDALPVAVDPV
jgi:hypothetical protein